MRRLAGAGRAAAASGGTGGRAAALARSLRCAAGGLLLAFAALLALPPQAQAQTVETLVSNTGQTAGDQNGFVGTIAGSNWLAGQGFTTGDNTDGYTLSSVQLYIKYFDASDVANVSIYSSVSDNPGSSLYVLTSPASIVNERLNTFTARANATLEKDTEYIVVVEASGGGWFALPLTSSGAEDSGKASGWSISDARPVKQNLLAGRTEPRVLRISVMGTVNGGTAATGKPSISGTAQVGQTLTASTSGIMDVDGPPTGFTYQWVRVDGITETDISGATSSTYTPSSSDVGKTIKVKVSFNDGAGNPEGPLASDAYPSEPPDATVVAAQGSCPSDADWCATLTMGYDSGTLASVVSLTK